MRLHVSDIRAQRHIETAEYLSPQNILGAPPPFIRFGDPLHAKIQADIAGEDIFIKGSVSTAVGMTCARCLENFRQNLSLQFQQTFETKEEIIDLTSDIREAVLLDLPMRALCRKDCQGLCYVCGINKNRTQCDCTSSSVDPRWDVLKKFPFK